MVQSEDRMRTMFTSQPEIRAVKDKRIMLGITSWKEEEK